MAQADALASLAYAIKLKIPGAFLGTLKAGHGRIHSAP